MQDLQTQGGLSLHAPWRTHIEHIQFTQCDRARSRCSRCRNQNLPCNPSTTARWRIEGIDSTRQRIRSHRTSKPKEPPLELDLSDSLVPSDLSTKSPADPPVQLSISDVVLADDLDPFWAIGLDSSCPELDGITFEDVETPTNSFAQSISPRGWHEAGGPVDNLSPRFTDSRFTPRSLHATCPTSYLWTEFTESIAPRITINNKEQTNQVTKYLACKAEGRPSLFSAIIFLSYSVKLNWKMRYPILVDTTAMTSAAIQMEQQAVTYIGDIMSCHAEIQPTGYEASENPTHPTYCITALSTLITLSSAYIAGNNLRSLRVCLEHAIRITRKGFTTELATDESFLFLVRWLGYIHIVALFDETDYPIVAPNYFEIAAKQDHCSSDRDAFFQDVDSFIGISHAVGDLLYRLGRLLQAMKMKTCSSNDENTSPYSSDPEAVDVETRMQLLLRRLKNFEKQNGHLSHFDHYNAALLYSCLLRFLLDLKEESCTSSLVQCTVTQILDSCAAVPADAPVAKLMLLPLFTAGSCTTRPLHHDFIRRRLDVLQSGYCIANVTLLMNILEARWNQSKKGKDQSMSLLSNISSPVSSGQPIAKASACVLF